MQINVVVRNSDNLIEKVCSIDYDSKHFNDLESISDYLKENYNVECGYYRCEYDIECKKKYIYYLSSKNKMLNLAVDFESLEFSKYYKITKKSQLTINVVLETGGYGAAGGPGIIGWLQILFFVRDIVLSITSILSFIKIYFFPFKEIKKKYGYGANFIYDILDNQDTWQYGVLALEKIKLNRILEFSVMNRFGYKIQNKNWIRKILPNPARHLNKYDNY